MSIQPRQAAMVFNQVQAIPEGTRIFIEASDRQAIKDRAKQWAYKDFIKDFTREEITDDHIEMGGRAGWHLYQDCCKHDKRATLTEPASRLTDDIEAYEVRFIAAYIEAYIEEHYNIRARRARNRQQDTAKPALLVAER